MPVLLYLGLIGHADYWKQSRWWWGVLCDGTAGLMIWPAMPILAAQALQKCLFWSQKNLNGWTLQPLQPNRQESA